MKFLVALMLVAASKGGVTMPDSVEVSGRKLVLNGLGIREATIFNVDVYVAGLYVEKKSRDGTALINTEGPQRLVLQFVRDVDRSDLTSAWSEGFEKNGGGKLRANVDKLNSFMSNMKKGDRMVLTYVPDKGLIVEVNGKKKGTIGGSHFAKIMWKIFLGPNPPNKGLKNGLLGR